MDLVQLPFEVFREILLRTPIDKLLEFCVVNSQVQNLCKDPVFWEDKVNDTYPGYAGRLHHTWKDTAKLLFYGKSITAIESLDPTSSTAAVSRRKIKLDGNSTFADLRGYKLFNTIDDQYDILIHDNTVELNNLYGEYQIVADIDQPLYTVALHDGENLLTEIVEVSNYNIMTYF